MNLLEENQPTDLEQLVGLSRRRFIGAGALCGAALVLGATPGMELLERHGLDGLIVDASLQVHASRGWESLRS